jgi:hypothetical protein
MMKRQAVRCQMMMSAQAEKSGVKRSVDIALPKVVFVCFMDGIVAGSADNWGSFSDYGRRLKALRQERFSHSQKVALTAQRERVSGRFSYVNDWMKTTRSNFAVEARDRLLDDSTYNMLIRGMYESAPMRSREHRFKREGILLDRMFDYNHREELDRAFHASKD